MGNKGDYRSVIEEMIISLQNHKEFIFNYTEDVVKVMKNSPDWKLYDMREKALVYYLSKEKECEKLTVELEEARKDKEVIAENWAISYDKLKRELASKQGLTREEILHNQITPELVEKNFPKGKCQERGKAIILHAEMLIALADALSGGKGTMREIVKYELSGDKVGLLGYFEDGTYYHIHSDEMSKLERWIHKLLSTGIGGTTTK